MPPTEKGLLAMCDRVIASFTARDGLGEGDVTAIARALKSRLPTPPTAPIGEVAEIAGAALVVKYDQNISLLHPLSRTRIDRIAKKYDEASQRHGVTETFMAVYNECVLQGELEALNRKDIPLLALLRSPARVTREEIAAVVPKLRKPLLFRSIVVEDTRTIDAIMALLQREGG